MAEDEEDGPLELDWDRGPASLRNRGAAPASPPPQPAPALTPGSALPAHAAPIIRGSKTPPVDPTIVPIIQGKPLEGARSPSAPAAPVAGRTPNLLAQAQLQGRSGLEARAAAAGLSPPIARGPVEPFATSIARAFAVPFLGKGALWIPLLLVVLIGGAIFPGRWGWILDLAFLGMLANYFAKALAVGLDGEYRSPDPPRINNFNAEFVLPGLAFLGLLVALSALPMYQAFRIGESMQRTWEASAEAGAKRFDERPDVKTEALNPDEVFLDANGQIVHPKGDDRPMILKRSDGRWVRVEPAWGVVVYVPGNDPANAAQLGAPGAGGAGAASEASASPPLSASAIPVGQALLFLVLLMLPFFYVPMALAIASAGESVIQIFNPAHVMGAAARGGLAYVAVVMVGWVAMLVPTVFAGKMMLAGGLLAGRAIFLGGLGYTFAVQGYLMGCLARGRPEMLPELVDR
jgi:hypothetical protein